VGRHLAIRINNFVRIRGRRPLQFACKREGNDEGGDSILTAIVRFKKKVRFSPKLNKGLLGGDRWLGAYRSKSRPDLWEEISGGRILPRAWEGGETIFGKTVMTSLES